MAGHSVVFFTSRYPYFTHQAWKRQELEALVKTFNEVYIAPLHQDSDSIDPFLPSRVRLLSPILYKGRPVDGRGKLARLGAAMPRGWKHRWALPDQFYPGWSKRSQDHIRITEIILQSPVFRRDIEPIARRSANYFFWGTGYALALPFLEPEIQQRSLVRFHGFDLYGHRYNDHMPYQKEIIRAAGGCAAVSHAGAKWLHDLVPSASRRIMYLPLGTVPNGRARLSHDGILRVVSCAYARPVKRLPLIAKALAHVRIPVSWTHIGDGPELDLTKKLMSHTPHITCNFVGHLAPEDVPGFYDGRYIDLFLNVSSSEGLPVSIMEAMAAGIPVLATDVGGTSELVDDVVGKTVPKDISPESLAQEIEAFASRPADERQLMHEAAFVRIARSYDIRKNAAITAEVLVKLASGPEAVV